MSYPMGPLPPHDDPEAQLAQLRNMIAEIDHDILELKKQASHAEKVERQAVLNGAIIRERIKVLMEVQDRLRVEICVTCDKG